MPSYCYAFGEDDVIVPFEFRDHVSASAVMLADAGGEVFKTLKATMLMSPE